MIFTFLVSIFFGHATSLSYVQSPSSTALSNIASSSPLISQAKLAAAALTLPPAQPQTLAVSISSALTANGTGVTEAELNQKLQALQNTLESQFSSEATMPPASGGVANEIALTNRIDALSNVTISNANISANSIPDLSGSYLSLGGGTVGSTTLSNLTLDSALSIANGGTGTSTTPTANKLLFSDTNGNWEYVATSSLGISSSPWTASGSNTYFTGGNVYIGTTSAQSIDNGIPNLDILESGASILNVQGNSGASSFQGVSYRNSAITHVQLDGVGYRGTPAAPQALTLDDAVTSVRAEAYDGAPGTGGNGDGTSEIASMDIKADENQTSGTQGGAFWFSTTNGLLLNQAQVANGFATSTNAGSLDDPDSRLYIGSNGDIGIGTGDIDCGVNTTCFLNADVAHNFPTQVYFGSNNGGADNKGGGVADLSYSTQVVIVPGTNQAAIPLLTVGGSAATTTFSASGNVGIGTTTPYARLTVWGPNTASSTLAFNVVNNASSTVFAVFDGGNAQLSGTLTQSSDQRLKTNITSLDASSSLALINELNPVTFNWIDPSQGNTTQLGFIAQQVQQVFPNLVSTTSPTALTPDGTLGVNYIGLISPIVKAIQGLADEVNDLIAEVAGFQESFTSQTITAGQRLCIGTTCINQAQLQQLLQDENVSNQASDSDTQVDQSSNSDATTSDNTDSSNDESGTSTDATSTPD